MFGHPCICSFQLLLPLSICSKGFLGLSLQPSHKMNTRTLGARLSTFSPSRRDTLAAIFRKAHERVSPAAARWLNPEESIGRYIGKVKWDHIWEATGPARDVFNKVAPNIKSYLEDSVEPISSRVTWSMYMIGRAPGLASPSIIFCCEILEHRRDVRNTIKDSGILNDYPGIKTGHLPRPPDFDQLVPLGAEGQQLYNGDGIVLASTSPFKSACGSQLFLSADGRKPESLNALATIGGVICLGGIAYYTTAAHPFSPTPSTTASDEAVPANDDSDESEDGLSLDGDENVYDAANLDFGTDDIHLWRCSRAMLEHSDDNRYLRDDILRQWNLKRHHEAEDSLSVFSDTEASLSLKPTGRLFMTSIDVETREAGLDYALIEMASRHHIVENVITAGKGTLSVLKVHSVVRSEPQDAEIVAVTSRGTTKGWISGTPAYSSAPGKRSFHKMLKVSLDGPLRKGDCGAWVIDARSGDLFGHIVFGSPGSGTALLNPFADIFDDIVFRVGAIPTFPTADSQPGSANAAWVDEHARELGRLIAQKRLKPRHKRGKARGTSQTGVQSNDSFLEGQMGMQITGSLPRSSQPQGYIPRSTHPFDPRQQAPRFPRVEDVLFTLSNVPKKWESPALLDRALGKIDLNAIYSAAAKESALFATLSRSTGHETKHEWGHQDCVIRALSRYFRSSFFTKIDNPVCRVCQSKLPTSFRGRVEPNSEDQAGGAQVVELYQCSEALCQAYTRFPRYLDAWTLLRTRRGRAGEISNCFGMLCSALGSRVRLVWNSEDGAWTEVYSGHQERWVHVDACEGAWDYPLLYAETLGKRMSYCVAFSSDGAVDVTSRYVRSPRHALARTGCPEPELRRIIRDIKIMRREDMSSKDLLQLQTEEVQEAKELQSYIVSPDAMGSTDQRLLFNTGGQRENERTDAHGAQKDLGKHLPSCNRRIALLMPYLQRESVLGQLLKVGRTAQQDPSPAADESGSQL